GEPYDLGLLTGSIVGHEGQVLDAVEQAVEHDPRLQPGQVHAEAHVDTAGERDVGLPRAADVKPVGVGPTAFVAIRRAHAHVDLRVGGDCLAADFDFRGGGSHDYGQRGFEAQALFDSARDQGAVLIDHRELFGVGQQ